MALGSGKSMLPFLFPRLLEQGIQFCLHFHRLLSGQHGFVDERLHQENLKKTTYYKNPVRYFTNFA